MRTSFLRLYWLSAMLLALVCVIMPLQAAGLPETFVFSVDLDPIWVPQIQQNTHQLAVFRNSSCAAVLYFSQQAAAYVHVQQAANRILDTLAGPGGLTRFVVQEEPTYVSWQGKEGLRFSYSYFDQQQSIVEERWIFLAEDSLVSFALGVSGACADSLSAATAVRSWRWHW